MVARLRSTNSGLREVVAGQAAQIEALIARVETQAAQIAELERRLSSDSSTSSKPPSSDPPYQKPARRSSRTSSGRKPGKQPGAPGTTMPLVDDPDETVICDPPLCGDCGTDLSGVPVASTTRRQVTDVIVPPPPRVTEYLIFTRVCPCCATAQTGPVPAGVPARAQYGPGVLARAAELLCGHYLPVARATGLMASMLGVAVSTGFMAGVRARAARLLEISFLPRVRELLRKVGVLHVDETPARADGALGYVHVAATEFLTAMHTGGRSKADIDAGQVLPGYTGTIVRDGYAGYVHLIDAHHAWCGAHLIRDLAAFHRADPDAQMWAAAMANTLTDAHHRAGAARAAGHDTLDPEVLLGIRRRYRGALYAGISDNRDRAGPLARDAHTLARRFRDHEDMILRFVVDLAVPWTNNQAERDVRPVKIQQRTSGGCWRTLAGLADFAVVASYLSTATKWGLGSYDVLTQLFTAGAWLPPAAAPC
ncbi:IS66 family transposase [Microbacterium sp.]|uniref:IS66 family transposase n=1 Tax=Microbacterium sp. TaxID=51671 RepID=UPI000B11946F|nr:IS66 family transposase [Microbacterium sp.]MBN9096834.1 IS66 family transposase [Pseudonocardia sp.]MBN9194440.1 IS66 family transposase [Microbacterium sp.]